MTGTSHSKAQLRILAIDVGSKIMGLAIWNPQSQLATPLEALHRKTLKQDLKFLETLIQNQEIQHLLVGMPTSLKGNITPSTENALFWVETLKKSFDLPLSTVDESLSTQEAMRILKTQGAKNKETKKDSLSAALFLEEFIRDEKSK